MAREHFRTLGEAKSTSDFRRSRGPREPPDLKPRCSIRSHIDGKGRLASLPVPPRKAVGREPENARMLRAYEGPATLTGFYEALALQDFDGVTDGRS
jgi:hypothetical protein